MKVAARDDSSPDNLHLSKNKINVFLFLFFWGNQSRLSSSDSGCDGVRVDRESMYRPIRNLFFLLFPLILPFITFIILVSTNYFSLEYILINAKRCLHTVIIKEKNTECKRKATATEKVAKVSVTCGLS